METADRTTSQTSRRNSLAAPNGLFPSKGGLASSTTSIASSDNQGDGSSDMKPSTDGALDKYKSRGSEDGQSESSSHRRKMSKLFKKKAKDISKRRKSSNAEEIPQLDTKDDIPPVPAIRADPASESVDSLGLHKSVASSLLTEDSDADAESSPVPVRPGISPHQSHVGYLTLSSPLITSETVESNNSADGTLVDSATSAEDSLTPKHGKTFDVGADIKRSASPVGRLREAFSPQRRSTSPKAPPNSDSRPSTSGGGLGALFGGKGRNSKILDDTVVLQASPPQIHDGPDTQSTPNLRTSAPKRIITQLQVPVTPPSTTDAPTTFVTPPTPTDAKSASPTGSTFSFKSGSKHGTSQSNPNVVVSPSGNMISHRRVRSATNPPSKLSNSISALTPTIEEAKTPGGTAVAQSGFFSSVFSAAQNAANTLSTTIANSAAANKNKANQKQNVEEENTGSAGGEEVIGPETADFTSDSTGAEKRRPAVETLGSGDLSLSHLGISESTDPSPMSSATNLARPTDEASARAEDVAAAQAVSAAYAAEVPAISDRPRSLTANSGGSNAAGAMSPPRQPEITDSPAASSIQRQGSIRSRISAGRKRRHRGSSATTGNTIGAAIGASTMTLVPQATMSQANVSGQSSRLNGTGFAVAPSKRNKDFHNLFKSVPDDDYLIEDYSAALQKEILLHGRLYVSEGHLCFSSNILGWVTNLVISFDEVVAVEKKSTAMLFPNGLVIQTLHARHIFASFLARDSTYELIIGIWKISHPNLKSSLNGVALDGSGTGDKTEKAESVASDDISDQDSSDEVYDEDAEEDEGLGSFTEAGEGSVAGSEQEPPPGGESRKVSQAVAQTVSGGPSQLSEKTEAAVNNAPATQDQLGAATHAPTDCGDAAQHYDKLLIDTTIPAPLGKIYSLMFGPASGVFMRKWLTEEKNTDLQMDDDKKGLGEDRKSFSFSYTKPLNAPVGPKQTKCNISMTLEQFDLDKAVTVLCSTATPDVPSGNSFLTKTRYCLMWGPGNSTRVIMTFVVEWSAKSWLKGPIEKGANDGQIQYANSIVAALKATVSARTPSKVPGKPGKGKRRTKAAGADDTVPPPAISGPSTTAAAKETNWGILEPIRSILGPIADIVGSIVDAKIVAAVFFILLMWTWFFRGPSAALSHPYTSAHRIAAYEQIWQAEEAELWKWMEERVALDRVHQAAGRVQQIQHIQNRLTEESMTDRQIDEAIRVTEERLEGLKVAVERERGRGGGGKTENETKRP